MLSTGAGCPERRGVSILEIFKSCPGIVFNSQLLVAWLEQDGWTTKTPEVPANLSHSGIMPLDSKLGKDDLETNTF